MNRTNLIIRYLSAWVAAVVICLAFPACGGGTINKTQTYSTTQEDSLLMQLMINQEFDKLEKTTDSLEAAGKVSLWRAAEFKVQVYVSAPSLTTT